MNASNAIHAPILCATAVRCCWRQNQLASSQPSPDVLERVLEQVGGEFAVSVAEQQRQLDALKTLDAGLSSAALVSPAAFEVCLSHPLAVSNS